MSANATRAADAAGFTVDADGAVWRYTGTLTFDNAAAVYAASRNLPLPTSGVVDLAQATHVDSSALAVVLGIMRRASAEGVKLALANVPAASVVLANVYDVAELFTLADKAAPAR